MTNISEPVLDELMSKPPIKTSDPVTETAIEEESPKMSEREVKIAYQRALQERKEVIKKNKELIADKELEVAYWKSEADLLRYRFEKMDFYLKNLEIEPKYLQAIEAQKAEYEARLANGENKSTLS
jgi:hypothetical protein